MFAIGFLIVAGLAVLAVILLSRLLPSGKPRVIFLLAIAAFVVIYPFHYRIAPSYFKFQELCQISHTPTIVKTKAVDFILLDAGFSSDCTKGPKFIGNLGYAGFDCVLREQGEKKTLYRFTRKQSFKDGCGLECFEMAPIQVPEAGYESVARYGIFDGDKKVITYDGIHLNTFKEISTSEKLTFQDAVLIDKVDGEMAFTTRYRFHPYGTGWAKILGMASGSAPTDECPKQWVHTDPRAVYKPKPEPRK